MSAVGTFCASSVRRRLGKEAHVIMLFSFLKLQETYLPKYKYYLNIACFVALNTKNLLSYVNDWGLVFSQCKKGQGA